MQQTKWSLRQMRLLLAANKAPDAEIPHIEKIRQFVRETAHLPDGTIFRPSKQLDGKLWSL